MNFLKKFAKQYGAEIARTVVLSLVGAIAIILTPVRDQLQDWFRPEQARVAISVSPEQASVGHTVSISSIVIPSGTAGLSGGRLSFSLDPLDALQLLSGKTDMSVPTLKDAATIPETPLVFAALKKGSVTVKAAFVNRKGQEVENSKVIAINPISTSGPSDLDYTGTWNLEIQSHGKAYHGQLCMDDKSEGLSGSYSLINDGERGNINGSHDGKRYWALLKPSGAASGWYLEGGGAAPTDDRFLVIVGYASLCANEPCTAHWRDDVKCTGDCFRLSSSLLSRSAECLH